MIGYYYILQSYVVFGWFIHSWSNIDPRLGSYSYSLSLSLKYFRLPKSRDPGR